MQVKTASLSALALFFVPAALGVRVAYDQSYDDASGSLAVTACSDGPTGLLTKGYTTFGSLPQFPNIGGVDAIAGWGSASCGSCWQVSYDGRSINVLAVDHTESGFNIALQAFNTLTDGQGEWTGSIDAEAVEVDKSQCGL